MATCSQRSSAGGTETPPDAASPRRTEKLASPAQRSFNITDILHVDEDKKVPETVPPPAHVPDDLLGRLSAGFASMLENLHRQQPPALMARVPQPPKELERKDDRLDNAWLLAANLYGSMLRLSQLSDATSVGACGSLASIAPTPANGATASASASSLALLNRSSMALCNMFQGAAPTRVDQPADTPLVTPLRPIPLGSKLESEKTDKAEKRSLAGLTEPAAKLRRADDCDQLASPYSSESLEIDEDHSDADDDLPANNNDGLASSASGNLKRKTPD